MQPLELSSADSKVLTQVFDPESGPARAEVIVDPSLPADRHITDATLLSELRSREKGAIGLIEAFETSSDRTPKAKEVAYRSALETLNSIIEAHPKYASARNNRAQLRRWRFGDRNMIVRRASTDREQSEAASSTLLDLQKATTLASPKRSQDAVSPAQGRLLAQAYTQLGALYLSASKDLVQAPSSSEEAAFTVADASFADWTKDRFEEEASRLFYLGGLYGNEVAKALAVHTNPHAKLCGSIVKEAMRKEFAEIGA